MRKTALLVALLVAVSAHASSQTYPRLILKVKAWYPTEGGTKAQVMLDSGQTITIPFSDIDIATQREMAETWAFGQRGGAPAPAPAVSAPSVDTSVIRPKCAADWPDDFEMRAYCEKEQNEAVSALRNRAMTSQDQQTIRAKCAKDWPNDFEMRNYCEEQQLEALAKIRR